jgi:hypothetical protein
MTDDEPAASVSDDPIVVYRTSLLHEADVVAEAMERARIPFIRRLETLGGLSAAMPVNPPPGLLPGNLWAFAVPGSWAKRADRFIAELPIAREIPATREMPGAKDMFKGWTWMFVLAIIVALLWTLIRMYVRW